MKKYSIKERFGIRRSKDNTKDNLENNFFFFFGNLVDFANRQQISKQERKEGRGKSEKINWRIDWKMKVKKC